MAKMVGLSRNLKLAWLNQAALLASEGLTENEIKEKLNEYLRFEIGSPTNIRKTREILMHIWFYENEDVPEIRQYAADLFRKYPDNALELHWCMLLATYPIFGDVCRLIGKMFEFQDEITLAQLKQKVFDEWGERATLFHSIDKLAATMKALDVLRSDRPGKYHIRRHKVVQQEVAVFMAYAFLCTDTSGYHTFQDLNSAKCFFPFEYHIGKDEILQDSRFTMNNLNRELLVDII